MHNNSSLLDNILGSDIRTYLGGIPDNELMLMLSLDERWTVASTSIQDYPPGSLSKVRMYDYGDKEIATAYFDTWLNSVKKNGPPELRIAAETLESRREGIFLWYDRSINNGLSEGINSLIQTTKRIARGYRNVDNFISMCYLRNGHLDIEF